ncbi:M15 family metallopeptidase [Noviherbaspirillum autotrophicum]|uniref:M15 family metallopeptidase n=1 Tax=Noviherbaspirillum autotrophicum TaxID=709839 RepID=UPI0038CDC850
MNETTFFLLVALLYGGICVAGGWQVMQAERRQAWRRRISCRFVSLQNRLSLQIHCIAIGSWRVQQRMTTAIMATLQGILHRPFITVVTLGLLALPALIALVLSPQSERENYPDARVQADPVVTALLRGEQLVPPPALPPDMFLAKELDLIRPHIANASRDWTLLDSEFRQRLLTVFKLMENHGYQMALIEGYRSPGRQSQLAQLGPQVTSAGAYQSYHQYGLAADSAFFRNGKIVISERDPWVMEGYRLYGKFAETAGLVWGGRWHMMDYGHVELRKPAKLQNKQYYCLKYNYSLPWN